MTRVDWRLRAEPAVRRAIEAIAREEGRSLSDVTRRLIVEALRARATQQATAHQ